MKTIYLVWEGNMWGSDIFEGSQGDDQTLLACFTLKEDAIKYLPRAFGGRINELSDRFKDKHVGSWKICNLDFVFNWLTAQTVSQYEKSIRYEDNYQNGEYYYYVSEMTLDPEQ